MVQINCGATSSLDCRAEMQPIFYKDNGKTLICEKKPLSLAFNRPLSTKTNKKGLFLLSKKLL